MVIGLQDGLSLMESQEIHSRDAYVEHTTFKNRHNEVVLQIAYWCSISMFHQGTSSKTRLQVRHTWIIWRITTRYLPRNEKKPIGEEKTIQIARLSKAITHELVASKSSG